MTPLGVDAVMAAAVTVLAGVGFATHRRNRRDDQVNRALYDDVRPAWATPVRAEEVPDAA